jgi:hypothetical protein
MERRTMNNTTKTVSSRLLGFAFGATAVVFYLGYSLTMSTVPRDRAIVFFNSLLHGLDVPPILRESVSASEVCLGIASTFILAWFASALVALFYNLGSSFRGEE